MDTRAFLDLSRTYLRGDHLVRIEKCFERLDDEAIWWRPNDTSNSVGNLGLHLAGNVRQWIVAGLGGEPDRRERDAEFAEAGPMPKEVVLLRLQRAVNDACAVLERLDAEALARRYTIQAHDVTALEAVYHVVEHFAMHAGQIVYVTKLFTGEPMGFYVERPGGLAKLAWTPTPDGPQPLG